MTNRILDHLQAPKGNGYSPSPVWREWRDLARKQIACRMHQVGAYVQEHPVAGIGTALCIGIALGWVIKRR